MAEGQEAKGDGGAGVRLGRGTAPPPRPSAHLHPTGAVGGSERGGGSFRAQGPGSSGQLQCSGVIRPRGRSRLIMTGGGGGSEGVWEQWCR